MKNIFLLSGQACPYDDKKLVMYYKVIIKDAYVSKSNFFAANVNEPCFG